MSETMPLFSNETVRACVSLSGLDEAQLKSMCEASDAVAYVPPAAGAAEKAKIRKLRHFAMQAALFHEREFAKQALHDFIDEQLGNLPLSVALCGHMLSSDDTLTSVEDLVALFAMLPLDAVDARGRNMRTDKIFTHYFGLVRSVLISLARLEADTTLAPKRDAKALLAVLSELPRTGVPRRLFTQEEEEPVSPKSAAEVSFLSLPLHHLFLADSSSAFNDARDALSRFGLLKKGRDDDASMGVAAMHQLVQACVREQASSGVV
jgi:hypothetical protein